MSENRCPMCGKLNPGELDICQYCHARITPLILSDFPTESEGYVEDSNYLSESQELMDEGDLEKDGNDQIDDESAQQDWLEKIRGDSAFTDDTPSPENAGELLGEDEAIADGEDWLERIRALHKADQQKESLEDQESVYEDLSKFDNDEGLRKDEGVDQEDWRKIFHDGKSFVNAGKGEEDSEAEDILPEWLREEFDPGGEDYLSTYSSDDDVSKWLKDSEIDEPLDKEKLQDKIDTHVPEGIQQPGDWKSELDERGKEPHDQRGEDLLKNKEEIPDWLRDLEDLDLENFGDETVPEGSAPTVAPFLGDDLEGEDLIDEEELPNWLTPKRELEDRQITEDDDLTPAQIPGWLAAIRPVNGEEFEEKDEIGGVEITGPLAGLRDILPVKSKVTPSKSPPAYSARLRITEAQQTHIDIIRKMLADEGKPELIPAPSTLTTQNVFRWLIGFLLILGLSLIILVDGEFFPLPRINNIPGDVLETNRLFSTFSDQKPALISFDYEPETSGEMHAVAAPLIDHLMMRGIELAFVSTKSTGPAMGNYFIQITQSEHNYLSGEDYVNLGFIPGGASGLLSLSQTPRLVLQQSLDGGNPWETSILREVNSLSDFGVILIITDNAEIARNWIEQVQPRLIDTPLFMAVSAQVEPVVRPYTETGAGAQVAGIISGISGGAAYELIIGKENLNREYWDAFNIGLIIILFVIFVGGAVQINRNLKPSDKPDDQGMAR